MHAQSASGPAPGIVAAGDLAASRPPARRRVTVRTARRSALLCLALLGAVAPLPAAARQADADAVRADADAVRAFDAYVARAVRDWNAPGLAIAVVKDDRLLMARGYGLREVGRPDAVDADTRFAIGSTTKAMTAAALAMLVDEGALHWNDPVVKHLPAFRVADPWTTRELTVRDLLTHRGGLPNVDQLWTSADYSTEEIVRRLATLAPTYSLRSGFVYQNVMYAVAGEVIAAASGMPWQEFFRTRIFQPLGMHGTEATIGALAGQSNIASPHSVGAELRVISNTPVDAVGAAGSVWSSVNDMARWMRFVLNAGQLDGRRFIREETFRELLEPQVLAPRTMYPSTSLTQPRFFTYGLGWFVHDYAGHLVAMHTGSISGMSAIVGLLPERGVGVFVLINGDHVEARHALMLRAFDVFGGSPQPRDWSADLLRLYADQRAAAAAAAPQARTAGAPTGVPLPLERYAGTYSEPTFGTATVTVRDGALHFAFGRRNGALVHTDYDAFRLATPDGRGGGTVVFQQDGVGGVMALRAFNIQFTRDRPR